MKPLITITLPWALIFWAFIPAAAQTASGVVNSYYAVASLDVPTNSMMVDDATGLSAGEAVLLIQSKGATIDQTNAATFGNITALGSAGNYEFNIVCNVIGNQVWLKAPFANSYDATGNVQLVGIPAYASVSISGTVNSTPWNPATGKGGIVAIAATGSILLNADIDVSGQGFQGGYLVNYPTPAYNCAFSTTVNQYFLNTPASGDFTAGRKGEGIADYILNKENGMGKLSNGGGGGNNANTGGAGGGNYGAGGNGGKRAGESPFNCHGQFPGIGGLSLSTSGYSVGSNRIFFGGGGGAGHENNAVGLPGGNGGGIIILSAPAIIGGGGRLLADGLAPLNPTNTDPTQAEGDGGGGGGAGGTMILAAASITGSISAEAKGGAGSNASNLVADCTGPGGGGGGGVVWVFGASVPAAITASVGGGINGVVSSGSSSTAGCVGSANSATAGTAGIAKAGYIPPVSSGNVCVTLASPLVKYFTGDLLDQGSLLSWGIVSPETAKGVVFFELERSEDHIHFTTLADLAVSADSVSYHYMDPADFPGTVFYRLTWVDKNGSRSYSSIVAINRPVGSAFGFIRLYPDPVVDHLSIDLYSADYGAASIMIFNATGQQIGIYSFKLQKGNTTLSLPIQALGPGAYFLVADSRGRRQVKSFLIR